MFSILHDTMQNLPYTSYHILYVPRSETRDTFDTKLYLSKIPTYYSYCLRVATFVNVGRKVCDCLVYVIR